MTTRPSDAVEHEPDCAMPEVSRTHPGRLTCLTCGATARYRTPPPDAPPVKPGRWRCRTHTGEPVRRNARGYAVGCPRCQKNARKTTTTRMETPE